MCTRRHFSAYVRPAIVRVPSIICCPSRMTTIDRSIRVRVLDDKEPLTSVRDDDFILAFAMVSEHRVAVAAHLSCSGCSSVWVYERGGQG